MSSLKVGRLSPDSVTPAAVGLTLLGIYLTTLAPGLTWANNGADGGDLITAASTLGVAHPTGYPTYLLLAHVFQLLPLGRLAFRTNLLSASLAALASALVAVIATRSCRSRRFARIGGLVAGLAFGLAPVLWSQAVITEVYTLHALLMTLLLGSLPLADEPSLGPGRSWRDRGGSLLFGLAMGNHVTSLLLLPPWLILIGRRAQRFQLRRIAEALGWLALGSLVYAYIPLRARAMPPVNWGAALTWDRFWWVVSGQPYQALAFGLPSGYVAPRVEAWAALVIAQFGWLGMIVGFYGFFFGRAVSPRVKWVTGWMVVAFSVFAIGYNSADSGAYLLPAFLAFAVWLGLGVATALDRFSPAQAPLALALAGVMLFTLLSNAVRHMPEIDASRDLRAETFGDGVMAQAPPGALIFTSGDRDTFALWYFHFALGERRDVAVIVAPLLGFEWYRDNLRSTYPDLRLPAQPDAAWEAAVIAANEERPACQTQLEAARAVVCDQ